jgi:hypothetical protein
MDQPSAITLYPNPATGIFNISSDEAGTLTVFTLEGKMLQQFDVNAGITTISLPANTAAGTYMCRFNGAGGSTLTIRLVYEP